VTEASDPLAGCFLYDVNGVPVSYCERRGVTLAWEGWRSRPVGRGFWLDGISVDRAAFDRLRQA
jgi:hypothetical protein